MRKTGIVICVLLILSLQQVSAADFLWSITHNDQDALVIGEIANEVADTFKIEVKDVISGSLTQKSITLNKDFRYGYTNIQPQVGDYLVVSLNKKVLNYQIMYGAFKVTSDDYKILSFVRNGLPHELQGDLAALQWYVNSNGKENNFSGSDNKLYVTKSNGETVLIFDRYREDQNNNKVEAPTVTTFKPETPSNQPATPVENPPAMDNNFYNKSILTVSVFTAALLLYLIKKKS